MSDPPRLLDGAADEFEHALLCSARRDAGPHAVYRRTLTTLGVAASVSLPLTAASAASAASGASSVSKIGVALVAKWMAVGATVGVVSAGGLQLAQVPPPAQPPAAAAVSMMTASSRPAAAPVESSQTRAPSPSASTVPPVLTATARTQTAPAAAGSPGAAAPKHGAVARPLASSPRVSAAVASAAPEAPQKHVHDAKAQAVHSAGIPPASTSRRTSSPPRDLALQREVRVLDEARLALQQSDVRRALQMLDLYRKRFPTGILRPEAAVLEVRAVLRAGDRQRALLVADRVLTQSPNSQHARVIRSLLGLPNP